MRWRAAATAVAALLLAGCTGANHGPAPSPTVPGPRSISLDGGALVVTPVTDGAPTVGRDQAARLLATVQVPTGSPTPVLASVLVTLPPRVIGQQSIGGTTRVPLAWVYLVRQSGAGGGAGCLSTGAYPPATPAAPASHTYAVILDSTTAVGYVYAGAGTGLCGPSPAPILRRASWTLSIPFTTPQLGPPSFREVIQIPACGSLLSAGGGLAMATVPTGSCHGKASTQVMTGRGRITPQPHARLGLMCWGTYDPAIGKPADCAI